MNTDTDLATKNENQKRTIRALQDRQVELQQEIDQLNSTIDQLRSGQVRDVVFNVVNDRYEARLPKHEAGHHEIIVARNLTHREVADRYPSVLASTR